MSKPTNLLRSEADKASNYINAGKAILYPTDTIWGIGCDPFNEKSVDGLYTLKRRPRHMPLLLLVSSIKMLKSYAIEIHPRVENLLVINKKPLTIIYPQTRQLPPYLLHENGSIGIRISHNSFCQQLINNLGHPIISTSANIHGLAAPTCYAEITEQIKTGVDFAVDTTLEKKHKYGASPIATFDMEGELTFIR